MSNMKVGTPNWLEKNWATLSLGSFNSKNPLVNLLDTDFGNPAISVDLSTSSTEFAIDLSTVATLLGNPPGADALFLPKHNLTTAATIRVKAGSAAFTAGGAGGGTIAYDSGVIAALPPIIYPPSIVAWGHSALWTGAPDPVMDAAYNNGVLVSFGSTIAATYWYVAIVATGSAGSVMSLARAFLGPLYQPTVNFQFGSSIDIQGQKISDSGPSGAEFISSIPQLKRVAVVNMDDVPQDEALSIFMALQMYLGFAKQGLFIYDPDDTYHVGRHNFMMTLQKPGALIAAQFGTLNTPLVFQEVI